MLETLCPDLEVNHTDNISQMQTILIKDWRKVEKSETRINI